MKIIAYYLPQFHEIPENNKWWGKGFTEWTNVKQAQAFLKGHDQPKEPLDDNYYNLLDKKTMLWQSELINKYKIYGLCFYHYWFSGKKILEKPAENLLDWKDIETNFCFCWANHTWKKSWNGTQEILISQTYGDSEEWEAHFNYLVKFFKDKRYIKENNKPIFVVYSADEIPNFDKRMEDYDKKCKENGFNGIYIVELVKRYNYFNLHESSSAIVYSEPSYSMSKLNILRKMLRIFYRKTGIKLFSISQKSLVKDILNKNLSLRDKEIFLGCFNGWDNTPRHKKRGYIIEKLSPKNFEELLLKQKKIMKDNNIKYLFFNAWNEWAEGMYLEPDKKNKTKYLEIIKKIIEVKD